MERQSLDNGSRVVKSERYDGNGNTYTTLYSYDGGGNLFKTKDAVQTEYETVFDGLGRPTADKVGGTTVRVYQYDNGVAGDGNLTQVREDPGIGRLGRSTQNYYDWRNRLVATDDGPAVNWYTYDNLGEETSTQVFDGSQAGPIDASNPQPPADGLLRASSYTLYDDRGRAYRTVQYGVDQTTGAVSGNLTTNVFYDGRGNVTKTVALGGLVTQAEYDGAGRITTESSGDGTTILEQVDHEYDANGSEIVTSVHQREPGSSSFRTSHIASWYDVADRLKATADYGVTGSSTLARPPQPPARSDTRLVRTYEYDAAGNVESVTDPRGIVTQWGYDNLGRVTSQTENALAGGSAADRNKLTTYTYNGLDQVLTTTVNNWTPGGTIVQQTTTNTYGGSSALDKSWLTGVRYPGATTDENYTYDNLGELRTKVQRNGVTHTFAYDMAGRQISDLVTNLPSSVDATVQKLSTQYDALGHPTLFSSEGPVGSGWGVINQVKRTYNGFGQLLTDQQSHNGSVSPATPSVTYTYGAASSGTRITSMVLPNGRTLGYGYTSSGGAVGQIGWIAEGSAAGTHLEEYGYLGMGRVLEGGRSGGWGESVQLDSLGRVYDVSWTSTGGTSTEHLQYGYDRSGNILTRSSLLTTTSGETYAYDVLGRQTSFLRAGSNIVSWTLDGLGNRYGTKYANSYNAANQSDLAGLYAGEGYPTTLNLPEGHVAGLAHDAWGRLVKATDDNRVIEFAYDVLGRRIETKTSQFNSPGDVVVTDVHAYYDGSTVVEERSGSGSVMAQYVWSPDGQLIFRDRDSNNDGSPDERLWAVTDATGTVTAVTDGSGVVQERYVYDEDGLPPHDGCNHACDLSESDRRVSAKTPRANRRRP